MNSKAKLSVGLLALLAASGALAVAAGAKRVNPATTQDSVAAASPAAPNSGTAPAPSPAPAPAASASAPQPAATPSSQVSEQVALPVVAPSPPVLDDPSAPVDFTGGIRIPAAAAPAQALPATALASLAVPTVRLGPPEAGVMPLRLTIKTGTPTILAITLLHRDLSVVARWQRRLKGGRTTISLPAPTVWKPRAGDRIQIQIQHGNVVVATAISAPIL